MSRDANEYFNSGEDTSRESTGTADRDGSWDQSAFDRKEARIELRQKRQADRELQQRRGDFIDRYTAGAPSEGFTTEEALEHLKEMRDELSPEEFQAAMEKTIAHLPADQRNELAPILEHVRGGHGAGATTAASSGAAAESGAARPEPLSGLLGGLFGGRSAGGGAAAGFDIGGILNDLRTGGLNAPASSGGGQPTEADFTALMNSPLARAVLGGVAAYAMQAARPEAGEKTPSASSS